MADCFNVVDLFCGAGGMSYGFELYNDSNGNRFRVISGLDNQPDALATFYRNHVDANKAFNKPVDISKITAAELRSGLGLRDFDVIVGGPPCQGFSHAGPRNPMDKRNSLVWEYLRFVEELKPVVFMMENVPGLLRAKRPEEDPLIQQVMRKFTMIGYATTLHEVNAVEYGVPQNRKRVLITGKLGGPPIQTPAQKNSDQIDIYLLRKPLVTSGEAILDLPTPKSKEPQEYDKPPASDYQRLMRRHSCQVFNHTPARHSPQIVERIRLQAPGTRLYKNWNHSWYKLDPKKPSPTVKENHRAPFVHPVEPRVTTPRECARLQSFPDRFVFCGTKSSQLVQIGNAVPPLLLRAFAETILDSITGS